MRVYRDLIAHLLLSLALRVGSRDFALYLAELGNIVDSRRSGRGNA